MKRFAVSVALAGIVVGASVFAQNVRPHDSTWVAPLKAARRTNPIANTPTAAAGGARLFTQRCATCHGEHGEGTPKAPTLSAPEVQAETDGALFWKISAGSSVAGMPAFSRMPEPQRWQLVIHLRTLTRRDPK